MMVSSTSPMVVLVVGATGGLGARINKPHLVRDDASGLGVGEAELRRRPSDDRTPETSLVGAFLERVDELIFDHRARTLSQWGDGQPEIDVVTVDDAARSTARAALDRDLARQDRLAYLLELADGSAVVHEKQDRYRELRVDTFETFMKRRLTPARVRGRVADGRER